MTVFLFCVLFAAGAVITVIEYRESVSELRSGLPRNSHGKGKRTEDLKIWMEGEDKKEEIQLEVPEQAYTSEEVQKLFEKAVRKMDDWILDENKSLDRVESDLRLITEVPGEPIDISWELNRYDVMDVHGKLNADKLTDEGTMVTLQAVLTYRERESEQALYECTAMVYPPAVKGREAVLKEIQELIQESDERTRTEPVLALPDKAAGKRIHFYRAMNGSGVVMMVMSVLIVILLYALERQNRQKELEKRRQQMRLDYPEIVNKLTLLLGAGMTVKRAWKKIAEDYTQKKQKDKRYAYEEMKYTCHEMDSGVMESESYERFGKRCGLQEYLRLGALLSQNLRKGTKGLNDLLHLETVQAFEERKARARRLGEEAGTKLLIPMFLMLAVVLVIVIVPAFLSVQL